MALVLCYSLFKCFLEHLASLSEAIHLLLGDHISKEDLQRAESLLDDFYKNFSQLYEEGSCGLNVHNFGAHLVFYVRSWGPLWAWSCFPFEDWNSALLSSVHGTGIVTRQCLRVREIQLQISNIEISTISNKSAQAYLKQMKQQGRVASASTGTVNALGRLQEFTAEQIELVLSVMPSLLTHRKTLRKAFRVKVRDHTLYSKEYTRMEKRICYVVLCRDGHLQEILYFIVNTETRSIFTLSKRLDVHSQSYICDNASPRHIVRVEETQEKHVFPVQNIAEKVFLMKVNGLTFIACMPNVIGHAIFK